MSGTTDEHRAAAPVYVVDVRDISKPNSRVWPLVRPIDALATRLALIDAAVISIDAQYYIWEMDASGLLMLEHVFSAADRGVQVRIIVDALHIRSHHHFRAAIDAHPNVSLRTYRAFAEGSSNFEQAIEFARDFEHLDHRMHNKLLVIDGNEAIVGGRNIADGHYGLSDTCDLVDFDVRIAGTAVDDFQTVFDQYWGSASVEEVRPHLPQTSARERVVAGLLRHRQILEVALRSASEMDDKPYCVSDAGITVVADPPDADGSGPPNAVIDTLQASVEQATSSVTAVTPFFVPTDDEVTWYRDLVESGTRLRLLTNSLASNEGTVSNSGLDRMRKAVVRSGLELYELKPQAAVKPHWETPPVSCEYLGLHAKLYVIDSATVLLGSVNLDPRSRHINTELIVRIESEAFAAACEEAFVQFTESPNAWRVMLDQRDRVVWTDDSGATSTQPSRNHGQALTNWLLGRLPISRYI